MGMEMGMGMGCAIALSGTTSSDVVMVYLDPPLSEGVRRWVAQGGSESLQKIIFYSASPWRSNSEGSLSFVLINRGLSVILTYFL